nr:10697_t:CDS:2 [Entrophospora candida]
MGRNNTIDETSEEHQRRLNRERQQRYHRNMDSEGSTGLDQSGEKKIPVLALPQKTT